MLRALFFIGLTTLIGIADSVTWAQTQAQDYDSINTISRLLQDKKLYKAEEGHCGSSTLKYSRITRVNDFIIAEVDHLTNGKTRPDLLKIKLLALYDLAECREERNLKDFALETVSTATQVLETIATLEPNDIIAKRELVWLYQHKANLSVEVFEPDKARLAYLRSISPSEDVIALDSTVYQDSKDIVISYVNLAEITENSAQKIEYLTVAQCIALDLASHKRIPDADKEAMLQGILIKLSLAHTDNGKVKNAETSIDCSKVKQPIKATP